MLLQEQVQVLTAQLQAMQNQLLAQTPAADPPAPPNLPKPPKVAAPTPFKGTCDDLN